MNVIDEISAERQRQVLSEGWTQAHDDKHSDMSLALVAAVYAYASTLAPNELDAHASALYGMESGFSSVVATMWPKGWDAHWFKPKGSRRDLIRAAALIVAEIERMDRAYAAVEALCASIPQSPRFPIPETREGIDALSSCSLWMILRSPNHLSEMFCNQITWVKAELRRRGFSV